MSDTDEPIEDDAEGHRRTFRVTDAAEDDVAGHLRASDPDRD